MFIDLCGARAWGGIEWLIECKHLFPVIGKFVERVEVQLRIALSPGECGGHGVKVRLRGGARHRGNREIDHVHSGLGCGKHGSGIDAGCVVSVEMNGDADFLLQRAHQFPCRMRFTQSGHVFDAEHVCAHSLHFLGFFYIVFQRILIPAGIGNVAGVADGSFANRLAVVAHRLHRHCHVRQVIE